MTQTFNQAEKSLSKWIQNQIQSGTSADFLPRQHLEYRKSEEIKFPLLSKTFGSPPPQPDENFTKEQIKSLEANRRTVRKFRWSSDPDDERRQVLLDQLYAKGYKWWEVSAMMPKDKPEKRSEFELQMIEDEENLYHQEDWKDYEWYQLYEHSVSENAVYQMEW